MNRIKAALSLFFALLCCHAANSQTLLDWKTLQNIPLDGIWMPNEEPPFPIFPEGLKLLEGKKVRITGYAIPLDPKGVEMILSANPWSACFFCGKAGPASVLTVVWKTPAKKIKTDQWLQITGVLRLNAHDPTKPYFLIEQAEAE